MNQITYALCNSWNHLLKFCVCVGKVRTNLEEKCVHCDKCPKPVDHNCFVKSEYYCYNPITCPFSNRRSKQCVLGQVICPLQNINACQWSGKFRNIWNHCKRFHRQNCFNEEAIIISYAHLARIEAFRYYTSSFLIKSHGELFRCSLEIHSSGTHRWCVTLLQTESFLNGEDYVFWLQFRPVNKTSYEIPIMSQCLNSHETLFKYPDKEIIMPKDLLSKYYNKQNKIFYRIFIDRYRSIDAGKYTLPERMLIAEQFAEKELWKKSKCLGESNYDEYCKCVKDMDR